MTAGHVDILRDTVRYWPARVLGQGSFSTVYAGELLPDGRPVAVKIVDRALLARHGAAAKVFCMLQSEIAILQGMDHPNIVKLSDACVSEHAVTMVLELCAHGTLEGLIKARTRLETAVIRVVMSQLASALSHLHMNNILHRDVKPANVLLWQTDPLLVVKLADFGFARQIHQDLTATYCGSPLFMAPEVLSGASYGALVDMWSAGVVAYQCLTGSLPFNATSVGHLKCLHRTHVAVYPSHADPDLVDFIQHLLQPEPGARISSRTMLSHRFITGRDSPPSAKTLLGSYVIVPSTDTPLSDRLALLEALRDGMAFYSADPLREMVVAAQMLRLLKDSAPALDATRFRQLFDECVDRITELRQALPRPDNGDNNNNNNAGPPSVDALLYDLSRELDARARRDERLDCYTKSIAVLEFLRTRASTAGSKARLSQSIRAAQSSLYSSIRFCGMCGGRFGEGHSFCQRCGAQRN